MPDTSPPWGFEAYAEPDHGGAVDRLARTPGGTATGGAAEDGAGAAGDRIPF
jgi:hypothetical protein